MKLIVHYDTCNLSSTFLHGTKLGPERREGSNHAVQSASLVTSILYIFIALPTLISPLPRLSVP